MNPSRKREAVEHLEEFLELSERWACVVPGQPRSNQRYRRKPASDELSQVTWLHGPVRGHPRFGDQWIAALQQRPGVQAEFDRVDRLWRREGLRVPQMPRRVRTSADVCARDHVSQKFHVWARDFVFDRTAGGRNLKWLSVVDEFTRELLCLKVARRTASQNILAVQQGLFIAHRVPEHIRSDNGPKFIAKASRGWLEWSAVGPPSIEPGSPWENGDAESLPLKPTVEFLGSEVIQSVRDAAALRTAWRWQSNEVRPHSSLGSVTPSKFANMCSFRCGSSE